MSKNINEEINAVDEKVDGESKSKKKLRGYALVRVIMMWTFATLFVVFVSITVMYKIRDYKANESSNEVMGDFNQITNAGTLPNNDTPVIITTPESTEETTSPETPADTSGLDEDAYAKYVAECIAEAKRMKSEYEDFVAIIVIEGDTINLKYPVLQSNDNQYYVEHLIDGSKNTAGEIFLDFRNNEEILENRNSVIYGHNMNNGTKFGQIHKFKYNNAFYSHNVTVITTEAVLTFKPFSFYKTDIYNPYTTLKFENDAEFAEFCENEQERSMFDSSLEFSGGERIITLSTCYGTSKTERYCLHAVLVNVAK